MRLLTTHVIQRWLYFLVVTFITIGIVHLLSPQQAAWYLCATFILLLLYIDDLYHHRLRLIGATTLFSCLSLLLLAYLPISLAIFYLILLPIILIPISFIKPAWRISIYAILLFSILSYLSPLMLPVEMKLSLLCLPAIILIVCQLIILFSNRRENRQLRHVLYRLKLLNSDIFATYIHQHYADNLYLYERRIHIQKRRFLEALELYRSNTGITHIIESIEKLYDTMLDYAQLRFRNTDASLFEVANREMQALNTAINHSLSAMMKQARFQPHQISLHSLKVAISDMETVFQGVIQVTAREPLLFILFIDSLKRFDENLADLIVILFADEGARV